MSRRGSPERGSAAPAKEAVPHRHRGFLFVHGILGAFTLGAYTIAGALGAALALLPVAVRGGPQGRTLPEPARVPESSPEASQEPLAG